MFSLGNPFNQSFQHLRSLETKGASNDKHNLFTMGIIGTVWVAATPGALPCSPCLFCHRLWPSLVMPVSPWGKGFPGVVLPRAFSFGSDSAFCILLYNSHREEVLTSQSKAIEDLTSAGLAAKTIPEFRPKRTQVELQSLQGEARYWPSTTLLSWTPSITKWYRRLMATTLNTTHHRVRSCWI